MTLTFVSGLLVGLILGVLWLCWRALRLMLHRAPDEHRRALVLLLVALTLYAGAKHAGAPRRVSAGPASAAETVSDEDIARGYQLSEVRTNETYDYSMPANARRQECWYRHGILEGWTPIDLDAVRFPLVDDACSRFVALTDGSLRPTPRDSLRSLGVGQEPMLAVPGESELWWAETESGSWCVTWRKFFPKGNTNDEVSVQVELMRSGSFLVRSNEIAYVYRRVTPGDWDGDGIPNDRDESPTRYDGDFFGPEPFALPEGANEGDYCTVDLVVPDVDGEVTVSPYLSRSLDVSHFIARANATNTVVVGRGETYLAVSDQPLFWTGTSDSDIVVSRRDTNSLWIAVARRLPPCGHEGCVCVDCDGTSCHCHLPGGGEVPGMLSFWTPNYVFVNTDNATEDVEDDLRNLSLLSIPYHTVSENDVIVIDCLSGGDRIALWSSSNRLGRVDLPLTMESGLFGVSTNLYVEGVVESEEVDDVVIVCRRTDSDGGVRAVTNALTVARVASVTMSCDAAGTSRNPPPFEGQCENPFDLTNSVHVSRHMVIPYKSVVDRNTLEVTNFTVRLGITLLPEGFVVPGVDAEWTVLEDTPDSGSFTNVTDRTAEFANPKEGGVYRFGVTYAGSPLSECNLVLPLAGANCDDYIANDLLRCGDFVTYARAYIGRHMFSPINPFFGYRLFGNKYAGNYLGRPANRAAKMAWHYNQVNDEKKRGATCTWGGLPTRTAKVSNFIAGYATTSIGVPQWARDASQIIGTRNDWAGQVSWKIGEDLATGLITYDEAVSNLVHAVWQESDPLKVDRQWPCVKPVSNQVPNAYFYDCNREFTSPGFLDRVTESDFEYDDPRR